MISAIITAGGTSSRFKGDNKLLYKIDNEEVIVKTVNAFLSVSEIDEIVISLERAVREADLILIATPVAQTRTILASIKPYLWWQAHKDASI